MIHISLFEPAPVLCEALLLFLATQPDFDSAAVEGVDQLLTSGAPASIVLLSIDSLRGDVWTLIPRITSGVPSAHVVLLSTDESQELVTRALAKGAEGFIHKRADPVAFLDALRRIAGG